MSSWYCVCLRAASVPRARFTRTPFLNPRQAPLEIVVQLVLKHPALAAIPPNVTITRAKNLSMALRVSLGTAGELAL